MQVEQPQAESLQPAPDLRDLRITVNEVRVPLVAPVDMAEARIRNAAQIRLWTARACGIICGD